MTARTLEVARSFAQAGFSVVPVRADGSKRPALGQWKEYQRRKPTDDELAEWFAADKKVGIALIHGSISGGSEVIDFDDPAAFDELEALCREHGIAELLSRLVHVSTPSGGRHVIYRYEHVGDGPREGSQKLAQRAVPVPVEGRSDKAMRAAGCRPDPNRPGGWLRIDTLIETRAEGGLTLAPGSPIECHELRKPYVGDSRYAQTVPDISADDRQSLLSLARSLTEYVEPSAIYREPAPAARNAPAGARDVRPGDDFNERGDPLPILEQNGWRIVQRSGDGKLYLLRPGKSSGASATFGHGGSRLLYVFSSSADPFEPNKAYTPFAVHALLVTGGDFAEAARRLAAEGYGTPPRASAELHAGGNRRRQVDGGYAALAPTGDMPNGDSKTTGAAARCFADIVPEVCTWFWRDRLPAGAITIIDGDPGLGKSTLACHLAAHLTRGTPIFGGCGDAVEACSVLFLACEDSPAHTMRPRLEAAGADLSRCFILEEVPAAGGIKRMPTLPGDIETIRELVERERVGLVVIDPLMAYLAPSVNSFRDQDVRIALAPLAKMAIETGAAILVLRHLKKTAVGSAIYRGGGSIGMTGAARSVLAVGKAPDNEVERILAPVKSNLGPLAPSLRFAIEDATSYIDDETEIRSSRVRWIGLDPITADQLLAERKPQKAAKQGAAIDQAINFLRDSLAGGPVAFNELLNDAEASGISERTLRRAKTIIKVASRHAGVPGEPGLWVWVLPTEENDSEGDDSPKAANFSEDGHIFGDGSLRDKLATFGQDGFEEFTV